ncbi:SMODS domain-containing nucleotidyltransferase [Aquirufa nivalisilvae]|uniref:SMODS domain-containing nucleotidyltransferase n=1 Tax=Aquirufa nivalisilvae TaxID=2516557 RepID=UPI0022A9E5B9|nr:hypothetical protein [Aquirufa nivalisilvae]MCZ2478744.1 nucleotidyltransferase [Aquirufa nivalisilvae]
MQKYFHQFSDSIRLTHTQEEDAKTKYNGVCEKLHSAYYSSTYTGETKFLFGSYKTKTNVRPISEFQDVDVLFIIPPEIFEKYRGYSVNGPAFLLQEIKKILLEKYTTTDRIKAWGKVVLVQFTFGAHNVEVLPAIKNDDGTYTIPNSENGGRWEIFDPGSHIMNFQSSNIKTNGLTAELARMAKTWIDNIKSFDQYSSHSQLIDIIDFLNRKYPLGVEVIDFQEVLVYYFEFLFEISTSEMKSHVITALNRSKKARDFSRNGNLIESSIEWRKVFGDLFPLVNENPVKRSMPRIILNPSFPYGN